MNSMSKHKNILIALLILIVTIAGITVYNVLQPEVTITTEDGRVLKAKDLPLESTTVQSSVSSVGKLVTAEYHFEHLEPYSDTKKIEDSFFSFLNGIEIPFTTSSFWYKCQGCIDVGINFEKITIDVDNTSAVITVTLPEVEIFACEIDHDKDEFYDEHNSIFNKLDGYDYSKADTAVKEDEKAKVKESKTMDEARANAERMITEMINALPKGSNYKIVFQTLS